ncbi:uncharacterized protein EDB93DRAFT_546579 [Suillus bovinus]|uniref:uncharacterized protein n=1 Tax=Suillus bovinus TaxID=48563 RepID=UPI001B881540|nr:uncharacterized protein EDB93DRAFT_546579 [Suillus bovinus]KAG2144142.1 hypothetical protein EDB93DRAFT_546579 [Suillus bovinus]
MPLHHANKPTFAFSANLLWYLNSVSVTNTVGVILWFILVWTTVIVNTMLDVIMMARIHAMYGRSKKMFIFLTVVLMTSTITTTVMVIILNIGVSGERHFSGTSQCAVVFANMDAVHLHDAAWIPSVLWEVLAFCLVVWIIVVHFCELRKHGPTGLTVIDYFTVLIKTHMLYFVFFAAVSCLYIGPLSPKLSSSSLGGGIYFGILNFAQPVQMFVLGPRLVLSVRQYHAKLAAGFDEETSITASAFRDGRHLSISIGT